MSSFNRACLAIYSIIWILACLGAIVLAWNRSQQLDLRAGDLNIQAFIDTSDSVRLGFTALMVSVALLGVATLVAALTTPKEHEPKRPSEARMLQVRGEDGGVARVPMANIENLLRTELESFPEIRLATARIRSHTGTVETDLDLTLTPNANIGYVEALANEVATTVLRDRIGLEAFHRPSIRCVYDTSVAKGADFGEPRLAANQVIDYIEPEPLPQIQWETPETRTYGGRQRPAWRQPADWERAADE